MSQPGLRAQVEALAARIRASVADGPKSTRELEKSLDEKPARLLLALGYLLSERAASVQPDGEIYRVAPNRAQRDDASGLGAGADPSASVNPPVGIPDAVSLAQARGESD